MARESVRRLLQPSKSRGDGGFKQCGREEAMGSGEKLYIYKVDQTAFTDRLDTEYKGKREVRMTPRLLV